ncbi:hypothetical protein QJS10_CPB04g00599 [Acorus calamus]|uniref:GrpE protein homolog n=1 Tax=Acorus calamus TaxID=4465 RepID=A0AAV9F1W2_ACOCL|nr:hypothetical protein QJS10_CPB04g00599 [Acorus calamus]
MATLSKSPQLLLSPSRLSLDNAKKGFSILSFKNRPTKSLQRSGLSFSRLNNGPTFRFRIPPAFAAYGEATETDEAEVTAPAAQDIIHVNNILFKHGKHYHIALVSCVTICPHQYIYYVKVDGGAVADAEEKPSSAISSVLQSYKDALINDDKSTVSEIEAFLQSIEDEKNSLASKVATQSEELAVERERILRISADFDNFRKRTERERLSLMENAQGEVVESLLPVLDNFERAKAQIKVETEGEEKINNSYQSIYKQFNEILSSLGVVPVETLGNAFDPLLHEAIMREDSEEYEEGIIIQEFRKGFKLGDRLLRPSMVKVSAGPGPVKSEDSDVPVEGEGVGGESDEESINGGDGAAS